jgi:PAS domain S-box-containing protein
LIDLAGKMFGVPVAYAAMLGHRDRVMSRIGTGEAHWKHLRTFPLGQALTAPVVVRDSLEGLPEGTNLGELRFAATVPLATPCGQHLGVLVIADQVARPLFSEDDLETLVELANVVAGRIELGVLASQLAEMQLWRNEAEERFRNLANCGSFPIACAEADGSCEFVNDAWLNFTGRNIENELGNGWQQVMHHQYRDRVLEIYWQALQAHEPFTLDAPMRRYDGVFRWMQGNGTPRFLKDGSFAGLMLRLTEVSDYCEPRAGQGE